MHKPYNVIYYPIAMDDVSSILDYISIDNPPAAIELVDRLDRPTNNNTLLEL